MRRLQTEVLPNAQDAHAKPSQGDLNLTEVQADPTKSQLRRSQARKGSVATKRTWVQIEGSWREAWAG